MELQSLFFDPKDYKDISNRANIVFDTFKLAAEYTRVHDALLSTGMTEAEVEMAIRHVFFAGRLSIVPV